MFFSGKEGKKEKRNLLSETLAGKDSSQAHDLRKRLSSLEPVENKWDYRIREDKKTLLRKWS